MDNIINKINRLKREKNAIILAHYYQPLEIQLLADIVGDSLELARKSKNTDADVLVFCGVSFMGESAALLCPDKKVLLPAPNAGCAMADTITPNDIKELKEANPESAVVCYINSTAETKAQCDICCTSSNAVKIVKSIKEKSIIFVPDKNLGAYVAKQVPEKEFIFHPNGRCPIHDELRADSVIKVKEQHPDAKVLVHPECGEKVCDMADFLGSTSQIIDFCQNSRNEEFIICTEIGVTERMAASMPDKKFIIPDRNQLFCANMKAITPQMVLNTLENMRGEVIISEDLRKAAIKPIERMLAL
ncbi:MAG: quinolinate synthase NadA [Ruminococcaceae bacterium]|nr:quinolinate synthase NadA [Oscillospiraceae bacterium]